MKVNLFGMGMSHADGKWWTAMSGHMSYRDQDASDGHQKAEQRPGRALGHDATEKDTPSSQKPGQQKNLGARQKRRNTRQNVVEGWVAGDV